MLSPLSPDLRRRFAELIASGVRLAAKVREGVSLDPEKCVRPAGAGKLGLYQDFLIELVEQGRGPQDPDITLAELQDALIDAEDVTVSIPAIFRMLKRLDFTYKKSRWSRMNDARPVFATPVTNG